MFRLSGFILLIAFATAGLAKAPVKSPRLSPGEAIVFLDSGNIRQGFLLRQLSEQLYFSQQLRQKLTVTIIDINHKGVVYRGPANYLKDSTGTWVAKYRPDKIPALFCLKKGKASNREMLNAQEIRICL